MISDSGDLELTDPVGFFGTNRGTIDVMLGQSPAYYQLMVDRDDFDDQFAVLFASWRSQSPVRATIRGTTIVKVEPA
jgi:hypothetical protein